MKTCSECKVEYPKTLEFFAKNGKYLRSNCKVCNRAYAKIYVKNNQESTRKRIKAWRLANLDKVKAKNKAWVLANPDKVKAINKTYRITNFEKRKAEGRAWKKAHPEKGRANCRKRNALKRNNECVDYTEQQVLKTYGTNCNICSLPVDLKAARKVGLPGWENGLHIDHLLPVSKGGPDTLENVRPTHGLCNITKNNKENYEIKTA